MTIRALTLCMIYTDTHILLGLKKRGFGEGKWNGFGGKVDEGETIVEAAIRECEEEACIKVHDIQKRGILRFTFEDNTEMLEGHLFSAHSFDGNPTETDEMKPRWFLHKDIPYDCMWKDDPYWIPLLLQGKQIDARFHFDGDTLLSQNVKENPFIK